MNIWETLFGSDGKPKVTKVDKRLRQVAKPKTQEQLGIEAGENRIRDIGQDIPRPRTAEDLPYYLWNGKLAPAVPKPLPTRTIVTEPLPGTKPLNSQRPAEYVPTADVAAVPPLVHPALRIR